MKALSRLLLLVLLIVPAAFAQTSVTTPAQTASATVLQGLTLGVSSALSFGRLVNSSTSGTATLSPAGVFSTGGGVTSAPGTATVPAFTVTGTAGTVLAITIPASIALTGPGTNMVITTTNDSSTSLASGTQTFHIGGTIAVAANQVQGSYSATYTVTVAYN